MNNNTTPAPNTPLIVSIVGNRDALFWVFQVAGWMGISIVSYLSLTLWYGQSEFQYIAHNLLQTLFGILISWPMRPAFRRWWNARPLLRFSLILGVVVGCSTLWTVVRLLLFRMITDEKLEWFEFGAWLYTSLFIFMCWAALYHGLKYYQLLQKEHERLLSTEAAREYELRKRSEAEAQAHHAQLKLLRYQLNPHFLFNTLNAVTSLVATGQNARAQKMLTQLSHFLRYSLASDRLLVAPLSQELEALQQYLRIEQTRFGERLAVEFDNAAASLDCDVPSLLLQPLVENAIKYAIAPSEAGGKIIISSSLDKNRLTLVVEDSGVRAESDSNLPEGTGVGLNNTRERLQIHYDENYSMVIKPSRLGGFCVAIDIPANSSLKEARL